MPDFAAVFEQLETHARRDQLSGMARYGMRTEKRLGVSIPHLRKLARQLGKDHGLALALWDSGWADARILAALLEDPAQVSGDQLDRWVGDLDSWDVCDQLCMNLLERVPLAWAKIEDWSQSNGEFIKRAAYALVACRAWHDKAATDGSFIELLPLVAQGASDERTYVRKAVSWALRNIGKRNALLRDQVLQVADKLARSGSRAARWVASDTVRDLNSPAAMRRLERAKDQ